MSAAAVNVTRSGRTPRAARAGRTVRTVRTAPHSAAEYNARLDQYVQVIIADMLQETPAHRAQRQVAWRRFWVGVWNALAARMAALEATEQATAASVTARGGMHWRQMEPDVCSEAAEEAEDDDANEPNGQGDAQDDDGDEEGDDDSMPLPAAIAH